MTMLKVVYTGQFAAGNAAATAFWVSVWVSKRFLLLIHERIHRRFLYLVIITQCQRRPATAASSSVFAKSHLLMFTSCHLMLPVGPADSVNVLAPSRIAATLSRQRFLPRIASVNHPLGRTTGKY